MKAASGVNSEEREFSWYGWRLRSVKALSAMTASAVAERVERTVNLEVYYGHFGDPKTQGFSKHFSS